jgi:hypothetical protein
VAVVDTVVVIVEAGRVVVEAGSVMSDVTVDAGSVMSSVMVDAAGIRVIVDVLVSKSVLHSPESCTETGVAHKVISGSVEVTVAVVVDIEVIVTGAWQDGVAEEVEDAEVEDVVLDVVKDNVFVKQ